MNSDEAGARKLAKIVNEYWLRQGRCANARAEMVRVEASPKLGTNWLWCVRSDLDMYVPSQINGVRLVS